MPSLFWLEHCHHAGFSRRTGFSGMTTFTDSIGFDTRAAPGKKFLIITLKVGSEARRVRQGAPKGALVYLLDENETRYDVSEHAQSAFEKINGPQPELTTKLDPHSSFLTIRVFEVPRDAKEFLLSHRLRSRAVRHRRRFSETADDPSAWKTPTAKYFIRLNSQRTGFILESVGALNAEARRYFASTSWSW